MIRFTAASLSAGVDPAQPCAHRLSPRPDQRQPRCRNPASTRVDAPNKCMVDAQIALQMRAARRWEKPDDDDAVPAGRARPRAHPSRPLARPSPETTDMADDILRVPLNYWQNDDKLARRRSTILRRAPLAVPGERRSSTADYVVRSVIGDSLLITRDRDGQAHVFLNYCRHRAPCRHLRRWQPRKFTCPYHAWVYDNKGRLKGYPEPLASRPSTATSTDWSNSPTKSAMASSGRSSPLAPRSTSTRTWVR